MISDKLKRLRTFILRKRQAYRETFNPESKAVHIVMSDLRKFCRATGTPAVASPITLTIDPLATGIAIGRLEVWNRIIQNTEISDADILRLVDNMNEDSDQVVF